MAKQKVLLTGSTGSMGGEALKELVRRRDSYDIVLLARGSAINKKKLADYETMPGVTVVWGDLTDPGAVKRAVSGVDAVLHPAALISPAADHNPKMAKRANTDGALNLIDAIKSEPDGAERIKFVDIGTVASYGDRLPPKHMVRVGDPLKPSVGDYYATTKMAAERAVIESGIKHWAVMRQTYIAIPDAYTLMDPILYHQPPQTHIELITSQDAGFGLVNALEAKDSFWGRVYNMGGGPSCRFIYTDYMDISFPAFGLGNFRKVMDRNWFALRNFHCCYYEDSAALNDEIGHFRQSFEDHIEQMKAAIPWYMKLGGAIGPDFAAKIYMKRLADPLKWIRNGETEKIKAFFGSREKWEQIGGWDSYDKHVGYDKIQPLEPLPQTAGDYAKWRGGECLSPESDDPYEKLNFRCAFGHEWQGSTKATLAGHWCPECTPPVWDYDTQAKKDPALASVYYYNHDPDEFQRVEYLYVPNA